MVEHDSALLVSIAVLGGTGKEGSGLAMRWALRGYKVIIGSRDAERAVQFASETNAKLGGEYVVGMFNPDAAKAADLIVMSVPYAAHADTLRSVADQVQGKILIDLTVPMQPMCRKATPPRLRRRRFWAKACAWSRRFRM